MSAQTLDTRAGMYTLLRRLYSYPLTEDLMDTVRTLDVASRGEVADALDALKASIAEVDEPRLGELNVEMTRLLEGPGLTPAPPYASFYLNHGTLMGEAASKARRTYLAWRVIPDSEIRLPDDHITYELGFMAFLAEVAASGDDRALEASRSFLNDQLAPWIPRFCGAMAEATDDPFFEALAELTAAVLRRDLEWLTTITVDSGRGGLT